MRFVSANFEVPAYYLTFCSSCPGWRFEILQLYLNQISSFAHPCLMENSKKTLSLKKECFTDKDPDPAPKRPL
jgi:hypothetical protein